MNYRIKTVGMVCMVLIALPHLLLAGQGYSLKDYYFVEEGPVQLGTLYADGSVRELHTEIVTWPMVNSDMTNMTPQEFKSMVIEGRKAAEHDPNIIVVSPDGPERGPNVIYNVTNPPPGALEAFDSVAAYIEQTFDDNVTVTITVQFVTLPQGVLGATSSYYAGAVTWDDTRTGLQNDMDADDTIQVWFPSGSTIPVRYNYSSGTATNENVCYFTKASYKAGIGSVSGNDAFMQFNTDFNWDYDPRDGITNGTYCFQSVLAHETGHCLGFTSAADFRPNDIEALDIYRFQNTDGSGDYNPDNYSEFQTTARMVDKDDAGAVDDDVISDLITVEYRMSDGTPYQCSHFKQNDVNAVMQPAFGSAETFYPHFYRLPDKLMFDAIGWDYLISYTLMINLVGNGTVEVTPDQWTYEPGTQVVLYADPDSLWEFDHWGGDLEGSQNPDTIIMDDDYEITAYFSTSYYNLTINVLGNGSVNKNPDEDMYFEGTPVELTAIPDQGWEFDHWSGNLWGSQNPDTIVMNGNKTVNAHFEEMSVAENQTGGVETPFVRVHPNPSSGTVIVSYGIGQYVQRGELDIYDVTGELVNSFSLSASNTTFVWDGRNAVGKDAPNGVYFMKFRAGDYRVTTKLLLLK